MMYTKYTEENLSSLRDTEEDLSYLKFLSAEALRDWKKQNYKNARKRLSEIQEQLDKLVKIIDEDDDGIN